MSQIQTQMPSLPRFPSLHLGRPRLLPLFSFIALFLVVSLFFVWSRLQVLSLEYSLASLETSIRGAEQEVARLRLEAASLRHPGRIEQVARQELGLRQPELSQIINVR